METYSGMQMRFVSGFMIVAAPECNSSSPDVVLKNRSNDLGPKA